MSLEDVKPGDKLALFRNMREVCAVLVVERVTKTLVIAGGKRWRKKDGFESGSDMWSNRRVTPATPELEATVERHQKRQKLEHIVRHLLCINALTDEELEQMAEIITTANNRQGN